MQDFGRKLAYNYYTLDNKFKLADNDTGGGGRDRDENLHDDPNPPIAYSNNSPTSPLAAPPTAYTTRSPSLTDAQSEGEAMEFEIDVNNPGFVTENGFLTPFDGDQEVPLHEKPEELEGNLPGFPQVNFGPIFEGVSTKKLKGTSKGFRNAVIDSFSLGHRRLYGMTSGPDSSIYISELLYGGIIKLNISSGEMEHAVSSFDFFERPSGGLAYYKDYLVVAGLGPTYDVEPCLHVYNVKNGDAIISCQPNFPTGQIMDVTVVENTAYATDSTVNQIVSMNMDDASEGKCNMTSIKLPNSFLSDEEEPIDLATGT